MSERHFGAGLNEWLHTGEEAGWNRASCYKTLLAPGQRKHVSSLGMERAWGFFIVLGACDRSSAPVTTIR
ncbi:MAG: hypothetical protein NVSMB49_19980 [Ktedonobacteraceae bacterium]